MAVVYDRMESPPIHVPASATASVEGFVDWATSDEFPEGVRITYVNRELFIDMSPEEIETHNKVKTEFTICLGRLVRELDLGVYFSDGMLLSNLAADLSTEPDSFFVSWDSFDSKRATKVPRKGNPDESVEICGAPDMVLEIVSQSTTTKDYRTLFNAYHRAGVREYWLVNAMEEDIEFQVFTNQPEGFAAVAPENGWIHSQVFNRVFRLRRDRDQRGGWQYYLDVKAA